MTYRHALEPNEKIVAGALWDATSSEAGEVSIEQAYLADVPGQVQTRRGLHQRAEKAPVQRRNGHWADISRTRFAKILPSLEQHAAMVAQGMLRQLAP